MTSREVLAVNKAKALQRVEALLPEKVTQSLPTNPDARHTAVLEHIANALERRSNKVVPEQEQPPVEPKPYDPSQPQPQPWTPEADPNYVPPPPAEEPKEPDKREVKEPKTTSEPKVEPEPSDLPPETTERAKRTTKEN